jgi:hypothetical protein
MRKQGWSIGRIMTNVAILAAGMSALLAARARGDSQYGEVGVLAIILAMILTIVTDRAFYSRRHRTFWLGFTTAAWLCAALTLSYRRDVHQYLVRYGPPIVRAREDFVRQHVAVRMAQMRGVVLPEPPIPEWRLACSLFVELGLGLLLGALVASVFGLLAARYLASWRPPWRSSPDERATQ